MRRYLLPLVAVAALFGGFATTVAHADTYTDNVAGQFSPTTHVVADPAASPALSDADQLNTHILSTHQAIYVAAVTPGQTGITTPDSLHSALLSRLGGFSGIIVVIDKNGYHDRAFNVPRAVADAADSELGVAAKSHRHDLPGTMNAYVDAMAKVGADGPVVPASAPAAPSRPMDLTWLWITLGIIGSCGALWLIGYGVMLWRDGRRSRTETRNSVKSQLVAGESDVNDLSNETVFGSTDVSAETTGATVALQSAREAYAARDYVSAQAHLDALRRHADKARRKIDPDTTALEGVPPRQRKTAYVHTTSPVTGRKVTLDNTDYRTAPTDSYRHYYPGGVYNGMFFYPGYYPYAFYGWNWPITDVVVHDDTVTDRWGGDYDQSAHTTSVGADVPYDGSSSSSSYASGWGTDSNWSTPSLHSSSLGASVGFAGEDSDSSSHHHHSSSYSSSDDSSSSSSSSSSSGSSFDFGGGFSGGGFDGGGGGGGFDSGGGSAGF